MRHLSGIERCWLPGLSELRYGLNFRIKDTGVNESTSLGHRFWYTGFWDELSAVRQGLYRHMIGEKR